MRRNCRNCLCRTCLNICCDRSDCKGKIEKCKKYRGFRQLTIFDTPAKPAYNKAPRYPWDYYGITKERYKQLTEYIHSGKYESIATQAAHTANKDIEKYILLSVKENLSYDGLQRLWDLKKIDRMACGRSDFYGYRRYFYHLFNERMKEEGK